MGSLLVVEEFVVGGVVGDGFFVGAGVPGSGVFFFVVFIVIVVEGLGRRGLGLLYGGSHCCGGGS